MPATHLSTPEQREMKTRVKSFQAIEKDILRQTFDPILSGERFKSWRLGTEEPQLRLYGGPGSGKTTFVAVAAQYLREHEGNAITVFIQPHNTWNDNTLEDIIHCVLRQLMAHQDVYYNPGSYFQDSTSDIRRRVHDIVARRLNESIPLFLLIDGFDSNDVRFQKNLEHELSELQKLGVKILVTSRHNCDLATCFLKPQMCDWCDSTGPQENGLEVYWQCKIGHAACVDCYSRFPEHKMCQLDGPGCFSGSKSHNEVDRFMSHPYQYSLINMDNALRLKMRELIWWSLENEHGDLRSLSVEKSGIPLSKLGNQLQGQGNSHRARAIVHQVEQNADGNVAMARLRLDFIHDLNDVDRIKSQEGIMPPDVTALLELAFNSTQHESVPLSQRKLALKAMTIVSRFDSFRGVSFDTISHVIELSEAEQDDWHDPNHMPSVDRIALSTKGLLFFDLNKMLHAYIQTFHTYLREINEFVKEMDVKLGTVLECSGQSWESLAERETRHVEQDPPV